MKHARILLAGCLLALAALGQQTSSPQPGTQTPGAGQPATSTTPSSTPTPARPPFQFHPRPPHTPLRGPFHLPRPEGAPAAKDKSGQTTGVGTGQATTVPQGNGTVVFSRQDGTGATAGTTATQEGAGAASTKKADFIVDEQERSSLTFTSYDIEVHLVPSEMSLSARARMTVRNDGDRPLQKISLQISSSLAWWSVRAGGQHAPFLSHIIDSDIDHTGKLDEALVSLPRPLAAKDSLSLDVLYSGKAPQSADRLLRLGAPQEIASASDWDRVASGFTGLRGMGNVVWFPVSTMPALLGNGASVFNTIGQWRLRQSAARVQVHLLVEHHGAPPTVAVLNGEVLSPDPQKGNRTAGGQGAPYSSSVPETRQPESVAAGNVLRVTSFTLPEERLGFRSLDLFVANEALVTGKGMVLYAWDEDVANAASYQQAAEMVRPLTEQWLGVQQKRPIVLVDLPESEDLPYEDRNVLFLPLAQGAPRDLTPILAHMSSHAYFVSPRIWLDEGVAQFMTTLWTEHVAGRKTAIGQLDSRRAALALAEPATPGPGMGQSLVDAYSDVYYRDKAAFVFWMLRGQIGDGALRETLRSYQAARDQGPSYFQELAEHASHKSNEWFFDDWVYRDRGLPDLKIASIYARPLLDKNEKNYLVSVDVENDSDCAAEVPVDIQSGASNHNGRLLVPARDRATVRILTPVPPDLVTVNDGTVPEQESSFQQQEVPAQRGTDGQNPRGN